MAKRVMVVDDDVNIRTALKLRLERDSLVVDTAEDGEDALRQIAEHRPDLVVLDLLLPRRDGLQVLARLRSDRSTAHIPIIILTAYHRPQVDDPDLLSSSTEVICKPFSPRYLTQRIHSILEAASRSDG